MATEAAQLASWCMVGMARSIVFFFLRVYLATFGTWYLILLGVIAIAVMLLRPRGLWGLLADRFDLHLFPIRRRLIRDPGDDKYTPGARS